MKQKYRFIQMNYSEFGHIIIISSKMICKNRRDIPSHTCNVTTQTEEFLLFLPFENKLAEIHSAVKNQQQNNNNKIQYLEYKTKYLEQSLFEMICAFRTGLEIKNSQRINQIEKLDALIEVESQELCKIKELERVKETNTLKSKVKKQESHVHSEAKADEHKLKDIPPSSEKQTKQQSLKFQKSKQLPICDTARRLPLAPKTARNHISLSNQQSKPKDKYELKTSKVSNKKIDLAKKEDNYFSRLIKLQAELKLSKFMELFEQSSQKSAMQVSNPSAIHRKHSRDGHEAVRSSLSFR